MKKLFIILAVMATTMGCTERQHPLFAQAWELIEDRPDSAKAVLEMVRENALTERGHAEYGLLKTIVDYKTLGTIKNDSLISASIAYYDRYGDDWHRGRAHLYRGALRMYRTHDIPNVILDSIVIGHDTLVVGKVPPGYHQDAIKDLKTAEDIAEDADDEKLKNHAYELMAYTNISFNDYPRVLKYSNKWLESSIKLNDSVKILRSLFMCASIHNRMGQTDSATVYTKKGLELAKHADAWMPAYEDYFEKAEIYLTLGIIKNAEDSLKAWEEIIGYQTRAKALKEQGKYEEAIRLAKLGIEHSDQLNCLRCWEILYEIYNQMGDKEQAAFAKMQSYNNMVGLGRMNTQMDDLQKNLDEERKTKDLNHRLSAMLELIIALIIVVAIAIVVGTWWHRRKVSRLSFRLDEDAQRISDLRTKIEQLEKSGKNSGQEMAQLKEELESRMERISGTLLIGTQMYNQLQQRQCIAEATAKEQQCLVDYFAQLRPKRWQEWQRKYKDLSTAQYVFLIMQDDLRYDDEAIAAALNVKRPSVRSMRSRIKGRER
jgi:tetratricopeptide (TPR) repeat protein